MEFVALGMVYGNEYTDMRIKGKLGTGLDAPIDVFAESNLAKMQIRTQNVERHQCYIVQFGWIKKIKEASSHEVLK